MGRRGLSGAVGCVSGCFLKGRGFDTQLRRLVFAQKIGLNFEIEIETRQFFDQKTSDEAGYRTRDLSDNSQNRNLLRH